MNGLVVGTKWFRQLPKEYQQVLVEEAIKAGDLTTKAVADSEKEYERKMTAEGATVSTVDVAPFKARAENAYKQLGFTDLKAEVVKVIGR
jgi:TRAP-type C4-dicarboxylate transport system substrate-binding protein